jgi:hypothetical protein
MGKNDKVRIDHDVNNVAAGNNSNYSRLQNLNKLLDKFDEQLSNNSTNIEQLNLLKGLPFYSDWQHDLGSVENHAQISSLSFNHTIGHRRTVKSFPYSTMNSCYIFPDDLYSLMLYSDAFRLSLQFWH